MTYDAGETRWEKNTGGGVIQAAYESGQKLHQYGVNQDPQPGLVFEAPVSGPYSIFGTVSIDETGTVSGSSPTHKVRFDVIKFGAGPTGAATDLYNLAVNSDVSADTNINLQTVGALQDFQLFAGERIEFRVRKVGSDGDVLADLSNVVIAVPEPTTAVLVAASSLILLLRRRSE